MIDGSRFILGPGGRGVRGRVRRLCGREARDRGGERHRCDHARAAGDGRGPGRRGRGAVVHVLRVGRGDPADGRAAGVLRRRPGDVLRDPRHGARGAHAAHEGGDRRAPVRQCRAGGRDRGAGVPVLEDAAQAAGSRSPAGGRARWARRRRSRSSRPRTSARSATAARSRPATTRSPSGCGCCAFTARVTSRRSSWSATTRGSTSCRRRSCASSSRTSRAGPTAAAAAAALPRGRASASWSTSRAARASRPGTCTWCAMTARTSSRRR